MSFLLSPVQEEPVRRTAARCRKFGITIPSFEQLRNPEKIPSSIREQLPAIGMHDLHPLNLYRFTWKNDPDTGGFGGVNYLELPSALTGVRARIIGLAGKFFPTGAHKVGAAFGCLVPRLISGGFDPERHRAVWPSTGNYCRGGAFDCALLGCTAVAILPAEMSKERFDWLRSIGAEVIATPGCESNVKEIYDKCRELRRDPVNVILNQFDEFGNPAFHYAVTGPAIEEVFEQQAGPHGRLAAYISATGSAGTIAAGDYLRGRYPGLKVVASEARQCPTLFLNGFGAHRIEGIGDKHVPWVHNVRNTDAVAAIDDADCMRLLRLFNEPAGLEYLNGSGLPADLPPRLSFLGISGLCNLLAAIKTAKYFEMDESDFILTVFTDSMDLYQSRISELREAEGPYQPADAAVALRGTMQGQGIDYFRELDYYGRKALHNLKYFTWVEQQGKTVDELNALWDPSFWNDLFTGELPRLDETIAGFNRRIASAD